MCINETIYMLFIDGLQNQVTKDITNVWCTPLQPDITGVYCSSVCNRIFPCRGRVFNSVVR